VCFAVREVNLRYTFQLTETSAPFSLHTYSGASSDLEIAFSQGGDNSGAASVTLISSDSGVTGVVNHPTATKPWIKVGDLPAHRLD
jgi:hypothetical protein